MNEILLIEPYEPLLEQYRHNKKIAIYSAKSVSYWRQADKKRTSKEISYPAEINQQLDIQQIKAKLDWWAPIWNRWIGAADDYEIYRRTCLLYVTELAQALIEIKTKYAIFLTSVSHHVEYSLIEIACQVSGVKQVYLYANSFNGRLLPLMQDQCIQDRRPFGYEVSDKDALTCVHAFRDNFLQARPPIRNEKSDSMTLSYSYGICQIVNALVRRFGKRVLLYQAQQSRHFIDQRFDYSALSCLKLINKQKTSLKYYNARSVTDSFVDDAISSEGALPILFAHYQPEATTFPEGGVYSNHVDIVIEMRRLGYRGTIFYKEHPASWLYYSRITGISRVGLYRSREYFKQLEALGCVFVETSFRLKEKHTLKLFPVTITGSVGVERSLVGLSTCCAGEPWYKGAPGTCSLAEAFGEGGVFFDPPRWRFDSKCGIDWFNSMLSRKTINNHPGIASGIVSMSDLDRHEFLFEFDRMVERLLAF